MTDSLHTLDIDGQAIPLRIRRNARARRLILRLDDDTGGAIVTIPKRSAIREGISMAEGKTAWIAAQLKRQPAPVPFVADASVPFLGVEHTVRHQAGARGIRRLDGEIIVSGREEYLARRLTDWLKAQAKAEISPRAHDKAARIGTERCSRLGRITIRDTRSRWGSCASGGQLNFSWRLVLAPEFVLDYVVAHEVAHLAHHNHGPAFWALADTLTARMSEAKAWLNAHGRTLHRYG